MSILVKINDVDITSQIEQQSLSVSKKIGNQSNAADFSIIKKDQTVNPKYGDDVAIYDGAEKIFGGTVLSIANSPISAAEGIVLDVKCVDYKYSMNKILASRTYEDKTISYIIADLISSYCSGFTTTTVSSTFNIKKIVFNQVTISSCLQKLADILDYEWDVDVDKDVKFFDRYSESAPFDLTDDNGNYIYKTLKRTSDGSQIANRIKVRGGTYDGDTFSDSITVNGDDSKTFTLPKKFSNLAITVDSGGGPVAKNVGAKYLFDFSDGYDVLYDYQSDSIEFETALGDGDIIGFSGNPKIPVFAISEDPDSIENYGVIEKIIREDSISSNEVARRRAAAELYAYAAPVIDAKFKTYTSGLNPGMSINLQSDRQGVDDQLMIKEINYKMRDHDNFEYTVSLISTKRYNLLALLQKILEPEPRQADEAEAAEEIFTDTQNITIQEETEMIAAFEDEQEINISEDYYIDALGAGVDAIYVLGPYMPTGVTDTKRPGRLGISFALG